MEYWTVTQAQAQAELLAKELNNRQILIYGNGAPNMDFPIGVEYEDRSVEPIVRYRKTGSNNTDWTPIRIIEAATKEEVLQGLNDQKMVTPLQLSEKLNAFSTQILGLPTANIESGVGINSLSASNTDSDVAFSISIPNELNDNTLAIVIDGYGSNAYLEFILGGHIGQVLTIRRNEAHHLTFQSTENIKLSAPFELKDANRLDNITLQKLSESVWVELTRNQFP